MAYVYLNPLRAGMASTPKAPEHTPIKSRCDALNSEGKAAGVIATQPKSLQRFVGNPRRNMPDGLPF